jgi:hypothetical protein
MLVIHFNNRNQWSMSQYLTVMDYGGRGRGLSSVAHGTGCIAAVDFFVLQW